MTGEITFAVSDVGNGLRERLDKEINAFNVAATGHADGKLLCIAVREDKGDLRAGLFGDPYGPAYYRGYVDRSTAVSVSTLRLPPVLLRGEAESSPPRRPALRWAMAGASALLLGSSAVAAGLAAKAWSDFDNTTLQAQAAADRQRYYLDGSIAIGLLVSGAAAVIIAVLMEGPRHPRSPDR